MGTTLSPFRYIQLARYAVNRWIDNIPTVKGKGKTHLGNLHARAGDYLLKSEAAPDAPPPAHARQAEAGPSRLAGVNENRLQQDDHYEHRQKEYHRHYRHPPRYPKLAPDPKWPPGPKEIYNLMNDERLFVPGAIKPPREVVVLCHGLYGFSTATPIPLFPSLKLHYWASVLEVLRDKMGVKVVVVGVKGTGSIKERAEQMHEFLKKTLPRGTGVNFVAHSMGGLDCRHLISTIKPTSYTPLSLTTIGTPHRGSPFMDWCAANIGVGSAAAVAASLTAEKLKALPYSLKSPLLARPSPTQTKPDTITSIAAGLTSYLLSIFDSPAYSNLTTAYLRDHFNPTTPDNPFVKYTSVAGRISKMSVLHPLWFPKLVLDAAAENGYAEDTSNMVYGPEGKPRYEGNDGLVSVSSAKWGEYIGAVDECHHWDLRGEGSLFPSNVSSISLRDDNKKGEGKHGGGWELDKESVPGAGGVHEHLGLAAKERDAVEMKKKGKNSGTEVSSKSEESSIVSPSSWDIAQVGQVVDWVTDFLPGGKTTEAGKRQLEEARMEKEGEIELEKEKEREKKRKDKFDLERFYGGLMIKLRDDGF
ncbi:hypothetical protein LQV05_005184 [Cryptococcus neoformans]|nr:triacylglycerol lipase [Cryptococcus neoformans var. grubii]OXC61118.1 triacylglycerol lipase [Cryptococcus neoformans var. grubii MW-RSA852]UOH82482.1 hypothetical protein LQV05_005184 [Cryptococcus neoformans]